MNPIIFAMRRPLTVMVAVVAVTLGSGLALYRMPIDIFPNLNLPVVYVCQPYGGMDPAQMEGLLTNYYEYHFLYIGGIHHVESRNIQGMALMKLSFDRFHDFYGWGLRPIMRLKWLVVPAYLAGTCFVTLWTGGPEEALLRVALRKGARVDVEALKIRLREKFTAEMPDVKFSFEPADIVSDVMSFGSPTPVEVAVSGPNFADSRAHAEKIRGELAKIPSLRDLQYAQSLDYPTVSVEIDRERAGISGVTVDEVSRSLVTATSSSRFVVPNYWPDPKTGIGYQVQVEIPVAVMDSVKQVETIPVQRPGGPSLLLRDVAKVRRGTMPGEYDRYNMKRSLSLTANIVGEDLGRVAGRVSKAIELAGPPPKGVIIDVRGQVAPMRDMLNGLSVGLVMSVVVILLLLTANFQSVRLALVAVSTAPAVVSGVVIALWLTGTTVNLQSFMGSIMGIGVAVANAILLVTFAERRRLESRDDPNEAAVRGGQGRLRAILMTSCAMTAGMIPMAIGWGEGGEQSAPLGRAVIGGLVAATMATLLVLPSIFALVQGGAGRQSSSIDPDDPASSYFDLGLGELPTASANGEAHPLAPAGTVMRTTVDSEHRP
jgi:multidrug efflux pump subunit AcrB